MEQSTYQAWLNFFRLDRAKEIFKEPYNKWPHLMAGSMSALLFSARCSNHPLETIPDIVQFAIFTNDPLAKFFCPEKAEALRDLTGANFQRYFPKPDLSFGKELIAQVQKDVCYKGVLFPQAADVLLKLMSYLSKCPRVTSAIFFGLETLEIAFTAACQDIRSELSLEDKEMESMIVSIFSRFTNGKFVTCDDSVSRREDALFMISETQKIPSEAKRLFFRRVDGSLFLLTSGLVKTSSKSIAERMALIEELGLRSIVDLGGAVLESSSCVFTLLGCTGERPSNELNFLFLPNIPRTTSRNKSTELTLWQDRTIKLLEIPAGQKIESLSIPLAQIKSNQWKLLPSLYRTSNEREALNEFVAGKDVKSFETQVDIVRCQPISRFINRASQAKRRKSKKIYEIRLSNVDSIGKIRVDEDSALVVDAETLSETALSRQILSPGDVLIGVLGSVGKLAIVTEIADEIFWVASQSFAIIRPSKHWHREFLPSLGYYIFLYLRSKVVWCYLMSSVNEGSSVSLSFDVLSQLPYVLPTKQSLNEAESIYHQVVELEDEVHVLREKISELLDSGMINKTQTSEK